MKQFEKGDRVMWTYMHSLNRKSKTPITKRGVFVRLVRHKHGQYNSQPYIWGIVRFDGNKTDSKILLDELKYEQMTKKIYRG